MPQRRAVITGLGAVTPIGNDVATMWCGAIKGESGAGPITRFDPSRHLTKIGCEVRDFDPALYMERKDARRYDRCILFAVGAARQAYDDSGLDSATLDRERAGVIIGTGCGGITTFEEGVHETRERGPTRLSPFALTAAIINTSAGLIAIQLGFRGPNYIVSSACASGTHAIGDALRLIRYGDADVILTGGTEAPLAPISIAAFSAIMALSRSTNDPKKVSRPFDRARDGFVMGEGAGMIVLEELEHALARGAHIYAEVAGYGASADAFHVTQPAPKGVGAQQCMRRCLSDAGLGPEDVQYINAHGTSTPYNDKVETEAIKAVFGEHVQEINVSSTKSQLGHALGATGGMEAVICAKVLTTGVVPPTINYETPDPECDLNYTPNVAVSREVDVALSNSFGFGGHNATVAFRRFAA